MAAAWGCRRGLELLLSQGADPELRDQDGLRPLDLAEQQLHQDCACVLRDFDRRIRTRTKTQEPVPEPEPEAGSEWGLRCLWGLASVLALCVSDDHSLQIILSRI